jgi:hypothetical protein
MGRPRELRVDRAILTATRELIDELGVRDFRVNDVVGRAAVGKGAILPSLPVEGRAGDRCGLSSRQRDRRPRTPARPAPTCSS